MSWADSGIDKGMVHVTDQRPAWAVRLQTEREARGWNKHEMARQLSRAAGYQDMPITSLVRQVQGWEKGRHFPRDWQAAYATAYDLNADELFTPQAAARPYAASVEEVTEMTERRALLQLTAAAMGASALGPLNALVDLAMASEPRDVDEWHLATADHLYALRTRPAAQVHGELLVDLLSARRQMAAPEADATELQRVMAVLSTLHAHALTRLGEHGAALRWERTARHAADASGDLDVRLLVRAEEAGLGLYGQRDPATILRLLDDADQIAGGSSFWRADLASTRAKALTLLGRHDEAKQVLNIVLDGLTASHRSHLINDWIGDHSGSWVHFARSWVYAGAGDEAGADEARALVLGHTRVLGSVSAHATNVRLHEALCTVVNGGVDAGARQAAEILDAIPPARCTSFIIETGRTVLRAVPPDRRRRPAVQELRVALAS